MLRHGACGARCVFTVQDTEGGYMQIYDNDLRYKQIQNKMMNMPQWAKAEHMEMNVPEKELWQYSGDAMCPSQKHRRRRGVLLTLTMALGRLFRTIKWTQLAAETEYLFSGGFGTVE